MRGSSGYAVKFRRKSLSCMNQRYALQWKFTVCQKLEKLSLTEDMLKPPRLSLKVFPRPTEIVVQKLFQGARFDEFLKVYQLAAHFTDD